MVLYSVAEEGSFSPLPGAAGLVNKDGKTVCSKMTRNANRQEQQEGCADKPPVCGLGGYELWL